MSHNQYHIRFGLLKSFLYYCGMLRMKLHRMTYQQLPIGLITWAERSKNITHLRDYLKLRAYSSRSGGYISKLSIRSLPVYRSGLNALLELGWITESNKKYHIRSVWKINYDLQLPETVTVKIRPNLLKSKSSQWRALCLAITERYRIRAADKYEKFKNKKLRKGIEIQKFEKVSDPQSTSKKQAISNTVSYEPTEMSLRYVHKFCGIPVSTASRLRNRFNGRYNYYHYIYDLDFDARQITSRAEVVKHVEAERFVHEVAGEEFNDNLCIFFDKQLGIYRKVIGTEISFDKRRRNTPFTFKTRKKRFRYKGNNNHFLSYQYSSNTLFPR